MPKINRGYKSVFEYLCERNFPLAQRIYRIFYSEAKVDDLTDSEKYEAQHNPHFGVFRWNPKPYFGQQIVGGFQPWVDMGKDLVDTFKPYKTKRHALKDVAQIFRGAGNVLRGLGTLVATPFIFLYLLFKKGPLKAGAYGLSWLIDGASSIVRGITQMVTSPFALLKAALRGVITKATEYQPIENDRGISRLIKLSQDRALDQDDSIEYELQRKCIKAVKQGRVLDESCPIFKLPAFLAPDRGSHLERRSYIDFFRAKIREREAVRVNEAAPLVRRK